MKRAMLAVRTNVARSKDQVSWEQPTAEREYDADSAEISANGDVSLTREGEFVAAFAKGVWITVKKRDAD